MKKNVIALGASLLLSLQFAHAGELNDLLVIAEAYTNLGDDNNYIDSGFMSVEEFTTYKMRAASISGKAEDEINSALRHCVFMKEGAYGNHFSDDVANRVINGFYGKMRYGTDFLSRAALFQLDAKEMKIASGIFNAPCVFAVVLDNQVLLLQAAAMD